MNKDTIVALATPSGTSALSVIRVSGPLSKTIISNNLGMITPIPRVMNLARFKKKDTDHVIDDLMYVYFQGPNSFSGEDSLELFPHGNMLIVKNIIKEILKTDGVRLAEPGEFTRRSFENGKIDLLQAESIGQIIHSHSQTALENAQKILHGKLSSEITRITATIIQLSAEMELEVDFAEEEVEPQLDHWTEKINTLIDLINSVQNDFDPNAQKNFIPKVVLYGKPNAGKSSLVNALLGEDRLLVSNIAGTTRDYIETRLFLDQGEIAIIDTAGLGKAVDELDAMSQEKTKQILEDADFKIHLIDGTSHQETSEDSKIDSDLILSSKLDKENFKPVANSLSISCKTNEGVEELKTILSKKFFKETSPDDVWIFSERQNQCLMEAKDSCLKTIEMIQQGQSPEILAFELQEARKSLEILIGRISVDEVLNHIFDGFCIGK